MSQDDEKDDRLNVFGLRFSISPGLFSPSSSKEPSKAKPAKPRSVWWWATIALAGIAIISFIPVMVLTFFLLLLSGSGANYLGIFVLALGMNPIFLVAIVLIIITLIMPALRKKNRPASGDVHRQGS